MREEHISIPLVMASTPQQQLRAGQFAKSPPLWLSRYHLLRFIQQLGTIVLICLLSIPVYYVISNYFINSVKVVGNSMVPTLQADSHYLMDRWTLHGRNPQRGDIVVIHDPGDGGLSVKRVIAVGGETVHFKNGFVYVNGKKLDEPYLLPHTRTFTYSKAKEQLITCSRNEYFVLGDNRIVSIDSRAYGPVSREDVLGLVKQ